MTDFYLFTPIVFTAVLCGFLYGYSRVFREVIKFYVFNDIVLEDANEYIKALPFRQRLSMTYIWKCSSTGKPRLGMATWYLICHYIHAIATIALIAQLWGGLFLLMFVNENIDVSFYIFNLHITYGGLMDLLMNTAFFALPVSLVVGIPISLVVGIPINLLSKNKYGMQTIMVKRGLTHPACKCGVYNVYASTKSTVSVRVKENETKEFKVVKGKQKFWISGRGIRSNELIIDVQDSIVYLKVGCYADDTLWIIESNADY